MNHSDDESNGDVDDAVAPAQPQPELRGFFGGVGAWSTRERASAPAPEVRSGRRWLLISGAVIACVATYLLFFRSDAIATPPEGMLGAWQTVEASHADRIFWISGDSIAFQVGPTWKDVTRHGIDQIRIRRAAGDTTWFDVVYQSDAGENQWPIVFIDGPNRAIQFVNQGGMRWTPAVAPEWPES